MSAREDLNAYLSQLHRRLRFGALWRGGAIVAVFAAGTEPGAGSRHPITTFFTVPVRVIVVEVRFQVRR